jgi:CRP/FNR family transcriptional regulator
MLSTTPLSAPVRAETGLKARPSIGANRPSLEARLTLAPLRRLAAREHLWCEGDRRSHVYRIESGAICIYAVQPDGRRHVVDFAFQGDLIGFGPDDEHAFSAQTLQPTTVRAITVTTLLQAMGEDPALGVRMFELAARELAAARAQLLMVSKRMSVERVAAFLLALAQRRGVETADEVSVQVPMRRVDIADYLGLTIETVSRTFTRFRALGLIALGSGGRVALCDVDGLQRIANGEGGTDALAEHVA